MSDPVSNPERLQQSALTEKPQPSESAEQSKYPDRYECRACGYIYEPTDGDSRANIPAGTLFPDIAENWRCPVCRASKNQFINIGPKGAPSGFEENLGYGFGVNAMTPARKRVLIFGGLILAFLFLMSFYGVR